ncbi:MAG: hypothetical protein LV481_05390 [Methylacidiphilales bacterium]|nr:hypothetical protein [Candidatus Methylacidiphilales bacterium]
MKPSFLLSLAVVLLAALPSPVFGQTATTVTPAPANANVETIIAIRHGEKPPGGLGNLTCRGLNRALALPNVLIPRYGKPDYVFAPNPEEQVTDKGGKFYYIRPLITIDPTAIRCGLPVNTPYGYTEIDQLAAELKKPAYQHAVVFIAWEHLKLDDFAKLMVKSYGGDPGQVPPWPHDDFDTIFVFKITHQDGKDTLAFTIDHEGLNNLSDTCP